LNAYEGPSRNSTLRVTRARRSQHRSDVRGETGRERARLSPREQFGNLIKRQLDVAQSADGQRVAACSES
jgi:hypothetical protein